MTDAASQQPTANPHPGPAQAPAREGPFAPIAPGARLTYVWATPIAQIMIYLVSAVPAFLIGLVLVIPMLAGADSEALQAGELPPGAEMRLYAALIAIQFPAWALLIVAWVRGFERRSLASAGFVWENASRRYGLGLLIGVAVAGGLTLLAPLVEPDAAISLDGLQLSTLLKPAWLLVLIGVTVMFLVQGACEEVAFRGWMLSAVAARRGLMAGVVFNSAVFGALHAHVFASGPIVGMSAIAAITAVGLFMSLWAVREGTIIGVCGVHGAFNATLLLTGLVAGAAADPDAGPGVVLLDVLKEATALEGDGSAAGALLQLFIFAALSALIWTRVTARRGQA